MKKKNIAFIVFFIALLIVSIGIETYIYNKKENLYSEMLRQIRNAFPIDETGRKVSVEALNFEHIENLEYKEVPIPNLPKDASETEKIQWSNRFGGIKHLYKLRPVGWEMIGIIKGEIPSSYYDFVYNRNEDALCEYYYFPYMIGVADGADFNINIAQSIIKKSLEVVYCYPKEYEDFKNNINTPNDYFHMGGFYLGEDSLPDPLNIYNQVIGSNPIFDSNNKFTGYYWYGIHNFYPYRVLHVYHKKSFTTIMEKEGFNGPLKDRVIYYGIVVFIITLLLVLYRNKNKFNFKIFRHTTKYLEGKNYCKYCGKIIDSNSGYCKYCGKKL